MVEISKIYEPKEIEDKIYRFWEKTGFFNPDKLPGNRSKKFCVAIPPPNVTGELHMGHALNGTAQDIVIRWKRMQGLKTLWVPGTDHAGIATQNVVEKMLKKEGITRFDLGKEKFIKKVWEWKEKYGNLILGQFKKLGCSLDWSRTNFTMNAGYAEAVQEAFLSYYKKGWLYKGKRIVNWCPRCGTSLSDLELEYEEEKTKLWHIRYPFKDGSGDIIVATTRPETMLGDAAVAVNPKDDKYKDKIGKVLILPIAGREIPVVADRLVDQEFGTGAVKVTPSHDLTDEQIARNHNLQGIDIIDERGRITDLAPEIFRGLKTMEAREKIVQILETDGFLEKTDEYIHQIPKCYRCGQTVELIRSWQWFLKMEKLAQMALDPVKTGKISFTPKSFEKPYLSWLKNSKDWCVSRQIWWGHRIPVWRCQTGRNSKFETLNSKQTQNTKLKTEEGYFVSKEKPKKCPVCGKCEPEQEKDVLDTWFSSALWPFAVLGWPKKTNDLKNFYPTDFLATDRGIINLWVSRMIFSGMEFMKKIPFSKVYIHPTILTKDGRRMSKSLGTGINPLDLIDRYGADATRFGIAFQVMGGQDIRFGEENMIMGRKFCNKIWNASRFILMNSPESISSDFKPKAKDKSDRVFLKKLASAKKNLEKNIAEMEFGPACHLLYDFFWHDFCDRYIEESKKEIGGKEKKKMLLYGLFSLLKMLHPFIPFITEEIYQNLPIRKKQKGLLAEKW